MKASTIVWFQNDLRLEDNPAFIHGIKSPSNLIPKLIKSDQMSSHALDEIHCNISHQILCAESITYDRPFDQFHFHTCSTSFTKNMQKYFFGN